MLYFEGRHLPLNYRGREGTTIHYLLDAMSGDKLCDSQSLKNTNQEC